MESAVQVPSLLVVVEIQVCHQDLKQQHNTLNSACVCVFSRHIVNTSVHVYLCCTGAVLGEHGFIQSHEATLTGSCAGSCL